MSLASTVSSVIDVPATHSSGVDDFWPAWTEAISSSLDWKMRPPSDSIRATFGWSQGAWAEGKTTAITTIITAPAAATHRVRRPARTAKQMPSVAFASASDDDGRRADGRHEHERDHEAAEDRADRVGREQRPGLRAGFAQLVAEQGGGRRKAMPRIVAPAARRRLRPPREHGPTRADHPDRAAAASR